MSKATRVLTNGNSQVVRIPREFRLKIRQVQIFRDGDGDILIHPIADQLEDRAADLMETLNKFDEADIVVFEAAHRDQGVIISKRQGGVCRQTRQLTIIYWD